MAGQMNSQCDRERDITMEKQDHINDKEAIHFNKMHRATHKTKTHSPTADRGIGFESASRRSTHALGTFWNLTIMRSESQNPQP